MDSHRCVIGAFLNINEEKIEGPMLLDERTSNMIGKGNFEIQIVEISNKRYLGVFQYNEETMYKFSEFSIASLLRCGDILQSIVDAKKFKTKHVILASVVIPKSNNLPIVILKLPKRHKEELVKIEQEEGVNRGSERRARLTLYRLPGAQR